MFLHFSESVSYDQGYDTAAFLKTLKKKTMDMIRFQNGAAIEKQDIKILLFRE